MMKYGLTNRPERLIESFFNDDFLPGFSYGKDIDIYKKDDAYVVEADIPGFNKSDINIQFKGDVLTIKAEKVEEEEKDDKNYYYRSRSSRMFNRQIRFSDVDATKIEASYDNGVLKVTLPALKEADVTNKIEVK